MLLTFVEHFPGSSVYCPLAQLSKQHGRPIARLNQIPDEELEPSHDAHSTTPRNPFSITSLCNIHRRFCLDT
jgi:hypothetical protein